MIFVGFCDLCCPPIPALLMFTQNFNLCQFVSLHRLTKCISQIVKKIDEKVAYCQIINLNKISHSALGRVWPEAPWCSD